MREIAAELLPREIPRRRNIERGIAGSGRVQGSGLLHFPVETLPLRTKFRDQVLNYIFLTAQDLSEGRLQRASVSITCVPGEADSAALGLTLVVDGDWDSVRKLRAGVLAWLSEWSKEWSQDEQQDYGRRIYFGLIPNVQALDSSHSPALNAIRRQLQELKLVGPEWDGPGSMTPEPAVIDRAAAWLSENWRSDLGTPEICPTAAGGVSISWEWNFIEHSIDVRSDGAVMEWCQYNPTTLQTVETELPMNRQGWDTILDGIKQPAV